MGNQGRSDFNLTLLQDGTIELKFLADNGATFSAILGSEQAGEVATGLLSAAHGSALLVGPAPQPLQIGPVAINAAVPVNNWYFGDTSTEGQKAVVVEVGRTKIGFGIGRDQMRASVVRWSALRGRRE